MTTETLELIKGRIFHSDELLEKVKKHMIVEHEVDDDLILGFLLAAVSYAESKQKKPMGLYGTQRMPPQTEQAVMMLTTHFYESREGGTGGFFADSAIAGEKSWEVVNRLLMLDKRWEF